MNLIVSSTVRGVNEQIALWINVCADDWTAEGAIIASNGSWDLLESDIVMWRLEISIS